MPFLQREDVALHYGWIDGAAPPVVLIHGWCCDNTFLAPQADHFAGAGHAVLAIDLRGHGRSDAPRQPYPIGAFSDDVVWMCKELGIRKPVLIGHSMGGIVAFDIAARWHDLPAAIVMIDSAVVLPAPARNAIPAMVERLNGPDYRSELRRVMTAGFFLETDDPARREHILQVMTATPQHVMSAAYRGLGDFDASMAQGHIVVPSLYIAANEPSPRSDMARLREIVPDLLRGQTVGSGHFCQLEVPDQVNPMIDRFLDLTSRPAGGLKDQRG